MTKTQLLEFDGGQYSTVIERWGRASDAVSSSFNTISGIGGQVANWTGPAADQALSTLGHLVTVVASSPGLLNDAQDTVAAFVAAVNQQQSILRSAVTKAESMQCTVGEDGTVTPPPQPPGQPPQVCLPGTDATSLARAQEAYNAKPAVQNWRGATEQAPALQKAIQGALHAAGAADSRAAGDLEAGIRGGTDVTKIVSGHDPTGSFAANLYADTQTLGDGQRWVDQYVKQAADLLPDAAKGNPAALAELAQLAPLSYDQDFGAALMNHLGASGLEKLPVEMGQGVQDLMSADERASLPGTLKNDDAVLRFLGDSLASASNSPNLSPGFLQGLTKNDSVLGSGALEQEPVGFWALGQILDASSGAVPYDPQFLNTVGTPIIGFDRQHDGVLGIESIGPFTSPWANNLNLPLNANLSHEPMLFGRIDSGGDPIYGLMHAATNSPLAAQALFSSGSNLSTVLTKLPWNFDQGSALGSALHAATSGPGAVPAGITSSMVHTLAGQYENDSAYSTQMSGLTPYVAKILAEPQNIMAINRTIGENIQAGSGTFNYLTVDGQGGLGPSLSSGDVAVVLGTVSQNQSAYHTLQAAQLGYMNAALNHAVAAAMTAPGGIGGSAGYGIIAKALDEGSTNLAFLTDVKAIVGQNNANVSAATLQHDLSQAGTAVSAISTVAGLIPGGQVVTIPASVANIVMGAVGSNINASTSATTAGAQQEISLPDFSNMALASALLKNHAATPSDSGNPAGQFWGADGQLLSPQYLTTHTQAMAALTQWLESQKTTGPGYNQIVSNQTQTGQGIASNNSTATGG